MAEEDDAEARAATVAQRLSGLSRYSSLTAAWGPGLSDLGEDDELARRLALWPEDRLVTNRTAALELLDSADVVVVCDDHRVAWCRTFADQMIRRYSATTAHMPTKLTLALEVMYSRPRGADLNEAGAVTAWVEELRKRSPYPMDGYIRLLNRALAGHVRLLPLGLRGMELGLSRYGAHELSPTGHPGHVPARRLEAYLKWSRTQFKQKILMWWKSERGLARAGAGARAKLIVLCGTAHVIGIHGFVSDLREEGLRTVVAVPFHAQWERVIWDRYGESAAGRWFLPGPGVLRPAGMGSKDVVAMPWPREVSREGGNSAQLARLSEALRVSVGRFMVTSWEVSEEVSGEESIVRFVHALRESYRSEPDRRRRQRMIDAALACVEFTPSESLALICEGLLDRSMFVRRGSAMAARELDTRLSPLRGALFDSLTAGGGPLAEGLRLYASLALADSLLRDDRVIVTLQDLLQTSVDDDVLIELVVRLARYGYMAKTAVPHLRRLAESGSVKVKAVANTALARIEADCSVVVRRR